jgi:LPS sulfotransferase NodH
MSGCATVPAPALAPVTEAAPASVVPLNSRVQIMRKALAAAGLERTVLLASTFRSGSTYVAELLRHNGIEGLSLEKFNMIWETAPAPDAAFRKAIAAIGETQVDGVLAAKIMRPHLSNLMRCMRLERADSAVLAGCFPEGKWLFVKRRDKVRQAISFWRARQSGRWHVFDGSEEPRITYDYDEIRECYRELVMQDVLWEDFFAEAVIVPHVIEYEDLNANLAVQLREALRFCDVKPVGRKLATEVRLKQQSDAFTEEIWERFMADCYRYY